MIIVYKLNPRSWAYLLFYAYAKLFYYLYYQLDKIISPMYGFRKSKLL